LFLQLKSAVIAQADPMSDSLSN